MTSLLHAHVRTRLQGFRTCTPEGRQLIFLDRLDELLGAIEANRWHRTVWEQTAIELALDAVRSRMFSPAIGFVEIALTPISIHSPDASYGHAKVSAEQCAAPRQQVADLRSESFAQCGSFRLGDSQRGRPELLCKGARKRHCRQIADLGGDLLHADVGFCQQNEGAL
ncbi:MAG: hypothetical protein Q8M19_21885 [Reyranella sp.]|nr:hypothetical protein [Reyranella sp.]